MKLNHFTELDSWQKGRQLVLVVYKLTSNEHFKKDFGLRDQVQRSAVSIIANIAEGFGAKSNVEYIRFLSMSIRSIYETQSHLYIAKDLGYISAADVQEADVLAEDCMHLCKGLIRYLNNKQVDPSITRST